MAGTIQKKKDLVKELTAQEVLLANTLHINALLERKLSIRRAIGWTLFFLVIVFVAFTAGGVVASW